MSEDTSSEMFTIELTSMAHGGSALGRHEGRVVFIPYTIPGEIVEAEITAEKGRVAFARGVTLVDASVDRVFPRCQHFGPRKCGRCQWQHIDLPAQLLLKQDVLADQLDRIGNFSDADVRALIPSPQAWEYSYQMNLLPGPGDTFGYPGTDEGTVMPIDECHIIHPDLLELYEKLEFDFTGLRRLRLQLGTDGAHMLILWVEDEENIPELATDMPTSVNVILPDNEPVNLIGESHCRYTVNERTYRVTAGSHFRANVGQIDTLAQTVITLAEIKPEANVLDLYAGVGVFSAYAAPRAALVTLIESFPPAVTDADDNLTDLDNVDVIEGTVEDVLPELELRYDIAILDPPSEGISTEAVDLLAALKIPRLIYISSDPATLARDAKRLCAQGYTLGVVQPLDLNPHTYYVDAVAVLDLNKI